MAKYNLLSEISREVPEQFAENENFMLTAFECAVFENELTDGRYEYAAVNLKNGAELTLERRKIPITSANILPLLEKLQNSKIAGCGRLEIRNSQLPVQVSKLKNAANELFREILPKYGYTIRKGQLKLVEQLLDTIAGRNTLIAEAAVGLGKTLVYIIVGTLIKRSGLNQTMNGSYYPGMSAVEWQRMPILISTSSIALQKSVLLYIKEVSQILIENGVIKSPLRVSIKKGRMNYICEHNLRSYLPNENNPLIAEILNLLLEDKVIDLAETHGLTPYIKNRIKVPFKCYKNCPYMKNCLYMAFREGAKNNEYDFVVTNHNLLLMDAKLKADKKNGVLPPVQMVVIDEAHQLLSAARSIYGAELISETIPNIVEKLLSLNFTPSKKKFRQWREVRDAIHIMSEQLLLYNKQLFSENDTVIDSACDGILRKIRSTADYFRKTLQDSYTLLVDRDEQIKEQQISELMRLSNTVNALSENVELIRWIERDRDNPDIVTLHGLPKRLNEQIYKDLWMRGVPAFLTSGTLSAAGDFSAFKRSIGLADVKRITETMQPSPYDYMENCLLYLSENVPFPKQSNKVYIDALTDETEWLIIAAHGHTAVLFTSYNVMGRVYSNLQKRGLPFPLFKLERSTSSAIEQFKKSGNGVLFASGALWEGIDIPGDTLSMLIIAKLPFAVPDRISEYEQTLFPDFKTYFNAVLMPEMLIKLKQGFGRLIRCLADTGVVAILDSRVNTTGKYREKTLKALPNCYATNDLSIVEGFYHVKKSSDYFIN